MSTKRITPDNFSHIFDITVSLFNDRDPTPSIYFIWKFTII